MIQHIGSYFYYPTRYIANQIFLKNGLSTVSHNIMIQHIGSYFFTYTFIVETYCSLKIYIKVCLLGATKGIEAVSIINTESIQTLVRLC